MKKTKAIWGVRITDEPVPGMTIQAEIAKKVTRTPDVHFKFSGTVKALRSMDIAVWQDHLRAVVEAASLEAEKMKGN